MLKSRFSAAHIVTELVVYLQNSKKNGTQILARLGKDNLISRRELRAKQPASEHASEVATHRWD